MIAVVKTFERPQACERCVASIREHLGVPIVVVDDSREAHEFDCDHYVRLPFDSGLAAGRNAGVDTALSIGAERVLLLDDDLELTDDSAIAAQGHDADIVCGAFVEEGGIRHYELTFRFEDDDLYLDPKRTPIHVGHNFMLAKARVFAPHWGCRWHEPFKVEAEHLDFFLQAYFRGFRVAYDANMTAVHHRDRHTDSDYAAYRFRKGYYDDLLTKWGLTRIFDTEGRVWGHADGGDLDA